MALLATVHRSAESKALAKVKPNRKFRQVKLALDVQAASIVVVRMLEGAKAQPPQRFKPAAFVVWAKKQVALAKELISC